jgi:3-dehydroquinate dehydratase II
LKIPKRLFLLEIIENMAESTSKSVLVLHGPNLNLLGLREPDHYGKNTLADIDGLLAQRAKEANIDLQSFQSNSELELIQQLHGLAVKKVDFIIINPAAFTHTSVALRDALSAIKIPFVEVHLSNIYARETFRHHSYFSDIAVGVISGLGAQGYLLALDYAIQTIAD